MSVATLLHGTGGTSWPRAVCRVPFFFDLEYLRQSWQFRMSCSNWTFRPGQYTVSLACIWHLLRPKCPSWICSRISSLFSSGITILVPFNIRPSSIVSSSQNVQYFCISWGTSLIVLGHPCWIMCFKIARLSSACVASHILCRLSFLALSWLVIWFTCSLGNDIESFWTPNLDRQSATWFVSPGMYLILKLYGNVLMRILWSHGVAWFKLFDSIASKGFWSVSSVNSFPYKKWWNFSIAHTTANDSSSIAT